MSDEFCAQSVWFDKKSESAGNMNREENLRILRNKVFIMTKNITKGFRNTNPDGPEGR